jgi:NAD(P)-dependent dehydrogenase (short-subunit alcohol dehydrogenase family)
MAARFDPGALPDARGRVAIVTGGNGGIGLEAARMLARRGARVVLACRNAEKTETALKTLRERVPGGAFESLPLDLSNLGSVRAFAERVLAAHAQLDLLVNNAGVMAIPRRLTADGFEMQIGTNHLGHFALTGLLLERLLATPGARVVNVASGAHRMGRMAFDDLHGERTYRRWSAYGQSKLANLLFTFELARRLGAAGATLKCVACHPGYAATDLQFVGARMDGWRLLELPMHLGNAIFAQSARDGALPTVYAALADDVASGDYVGPDGWGELRGSPKKVGSSAAARSETDAPAVGALRAAHRRACAASQFFPSNCVSEKRRQASPSRQRMFTSTSFGCERGV